MGVIFATGAKFAGVGIGRPAYYAVRGLQERGKLHRVLCGSFLNSEIPSAKIRSIGLASRAVRKLATYDSSGRLWYLESLMFDLWARRQLDRVGQFHVWGNYGYLSLRRAKTIGMVTVVVRGTSHPVHQFRLLAEEHSRWGLRHRIHKPILRRGIAELELADYVLTPSKFAAESFIAEGFPSERLLQVPFGVDTDRLRPRRRERASPFRVLFVGQIGLRKGVPDLLEAWRRLGWEDAELWLAGQIDRRVWQVLTPWQRLPGVRWLGFVDDPRSLYQQADLFAFPTIEEGSALVTYEALACGLPTITTPNAGSVIRDGIEGFIVPIRSVDNLVDRMQRLRSDDKLRSKMGAAARRRAEDFTWEKYGRSYAATLEGLGG
jgi:glycosyltransferase involved in cell wall biosynthesis